MASKTDERIDLEEDVFVPEGDFGSGSGPRCGWTRSVCLDSSDYYVQYPSFQEGVANKEFYCQRHYVLTLANLAQVHIPVCDAALWQHLEGFGKIEDAG